MSVLGPVALVLALGTATAWAQTPPTIDGNIDDMAAYAAAVQAGATGCGIDQADPAKDIGIFDPLITPCVQVVDNYYINGFDMNRAVFAYKRSERTIYWAIRVEGVIGDPDGNGNADTNCAQSNVSEQAGIGADDAYRLELNYDCAGGPELQIEVRDNTVNVIGGSNAGAQFAFNGSVLEVALPNVDLPSAFNLRYFAGNLNDGLGEDTKTAQCRPGGPQIHVEKDANVASVCPGGFITYTIVVSNPGEVDLDPVNLTDVIPAGLNYVAGSASNGCGVGAPNLNGQTLSWPAFTLAKDGGSCTFSFQVQRSEAACAGANFDNVATAVGSYTNPCVNGGEAQTVQDDDNAIVACADAPCVSVDALCSPAAACPGSPVQVTGTATNCSTSAETIVLTVAGQSESFPGVAAGGSVSKTVTVSMPECTSGENVTFNVSASVQDGGSCPGTTQANDNCTVVCQTPQIDVEKSAEATVDIGGTIHYTITLTNPSKTVSLENIQVCDDLCSSATYADNASPEPASEPAVGAAGGTICWNVSSLAPGASLTFTFEAIAVGGGENCTEDVSCVNTVRATGYCGDASATDEDSFTTVIPCVQQGICRFTGGGTLNEDGGNRGHKQHSFGGNVSPCPTGDGTTGDSWEHVVREGKTIKFNFHSWEPCITSCSVVDPGPCHPAAVNTRADWSGPGKYSLGAGSRDRDCYFEAVIIDHNEGACNRGTRDEYGITVWDSETNQIVFSFPLQETDTGNLQIHETPRRLFGSPAVAPAPAGGDLSSVALLGRAYPNPFAASMSFGYQVPSGDAQSVEIGIYNVAGRLITRLASEVQGPGTYTVRWDGRDASGISMAPGVYFLKSKIGQTQTVSRLLKVAE